MKVSLTTEAPFMGDLLCARKKANLVECAYIGRQPTVHAESFPIDNLAHLSRFRNGGLQIHVRSPLPGLGNRIRCNKPSRLLGFHIFVDTHLVMREDVISCVANLRRTIEAVHLSDLPTLMVPS